MHNIDLVKDSVFTLTVAIIYLQPFKREIIYSGFVSEVSEMIKNAPKSSRDRSINHYHKINIIIFKVRVCIRVQSLIVIDLSLNINRRLISVI